jgi:hypothetical protein
MIDCTMNTVILKLIFVNETFRSLAIDNMEG